MSNKEVITVDIYSCIGCRGCEQVCPKGLFVIENKKARITNVNDCIKCGACIENCPVEALSFKVQDSNNEVSEKKKQDNRDLGNEWKNWDGKSGYDSLDTPKALFLFYCFMLILLNNVILYGSLYLMRPRLDSWSKYITLSVFVVFSLYLTFLWLWYIVLLLTSFTKIRLPFLHKKASFLVNYILTGVFKVSKFFHANKDRISNSFLKVANRFIKATHKKQKEERLLILLPRCLTTEIFKGVKKIGNERNVEVAIVEGGTLARKKIVEFKPTAVIGVACERDVVAGIKDVAPKFSVLGVNNKRPVGPCKNTIIDMDLLNEQIDFFLGVNGKGFR